MPQMCNYNVKLYSFGVKGLKGALNLNFLNLTINREKFSL